MIQGHIQPPGRPGLHPSPGLHQSLLRHRHPVMTPVVLLGLAAILCGASNFANTLFPLLALIGVPSSLFCLAIALVLSIAGILTGIVGIIERLDSRSSPAKLAIQKEHSYADCN